MYPEAQYDRIVCYIVRFDRPEGVKCAENGDDTSTSPRNKSVMLDCSRPMYPARGSNQSIPLVTCP